SVFAVRERAPRLKIVTCAAKSTGAIAHARVARSAPGRTNRGYSDDQNLGAKHFRERPKGHVDRRRARAATRAHRYWRSVWQEQRARISRDEPERPGAYAARGRIPAVGIQFDRALSRGEIWRRQARALRSARACACQQLDGLAAHRRASAAHASILGPRSNAA